MEFSKTCYCYYYYYCFTTEVIAKSKIISDLEKLLIILNELVTANSSSFK